MGRYNTALIVVIICVLVLVLCCAGCCISNKMWRKKHLANNDAKAEIVETAKGKVEYSKKGNAPYILCIHGMPGMHDGLSSFFDDWH